MEAPQKRTISVVSAGALALLTLSVFMVSLNMGPASAVTRFHEGVGRSDPQLIQAVVWGDINSLPAVELRQKILQRLRPGWTFQVTRIEKISRSDALVLVVYKSPIGELASVPFALHKSSQRWLIDPASTLYLTARQTGS